MCACECVQARAASLGDAAKGGEEEEGEEVAEVAEVEEEEEGQCWSLQRLRERITHYVREGRLGYALAYQLKLRIENELLFRFGSAASRRVRAVRKAHVQAFGNYTFKYDHRTPIHLVRSSELAGLMDQISWYDGLRAGGNRVVVTDIESTHARLLMDPETKELAEVLSRDLEEVDRPA